MAKSRNSASISKLPHLAWIFDDSPIPDPHGKGEAAVKFIRALKHPKSNLPGNAFSLDPWQERIVLRTFGDTADDGTRRIEELLLVLGRGNRKTSLMAACLMVFLCGPERRPMSTICSIANSREQAALTFREMAGICRATPRILEAVNIQDSEKRITYRKHRVVYEALSSDAKNAHGRTDVAVFADELWAETKNDLLEAVETGLNKSSNTILMTASTSGIGQLGPFWQRLDHARKVVDGRVQDETFLPILFEAPHDVDFRDEEWLWATNPGLPYGYPDLKKLARYREKCEHSPADRESYKRLHLSVHLDGAANPEWDLAIWDEGHGEIDLEALRGAKAWIGVDLSKRIDLSAVACVIELDDDKFALHVMGFSPEAQLRKRADEDSAPYTRWRDEGWLTACEGDIVDYGTVEGYIRMLADMFEVCEVVFDVAMAREMMESLERDGVPVAAFPQTLMNFAKPVDTFEDMFLNRRLVHDSPLLRWAVGNTVMMRDQNDNRRPNKARAADRIDPAVAAIMAVSRAAQGASGRSSYDDAPDDYEFFSV
ncbi:terminase large subunit [Limoniibacter endophyticus]|uniref:Terminase n=1 Tax=Limoniibacter endophyticus TaxID=1565040 RepID=A0A8J3GG40_9HYPH|nr:terminase TerL endonuclease subunit [Limoniibacter endophyticus]GHC66633.1 terminase [Limoniibacter endophyticus]